MNRFYLSSVCMLLVVCIFTVRANDVNTGGQKGILRTLSSYTLGKTGLNTGGAFRFATERLYVTGPDGVDDILRMDDTAGYSSVSGRNNPFLLTGVVYCAYGINSFLDVSLDFPLYFDITGWEEDISGAGDLELAFKMKYPFQKENAFFIHAYYLKLIFPTGSDDRGYFPRHSYYLKDGDEKDAFSAGAVFVNPMIAWTFDFEKVSANVPLQIHVNFGGVIARVKTGSVLLAAIGAEYTPVRQITLFAEIAGESRVKFYSDYLDYKAINNDPLWVSPGIRFNLPHGFYAAVAGDVGISDGSDGVRTNWNRGAMRYATKATPRYGAQVTFGWNGILKEGDRDADGVIDKIDKCADEAEDRDNFKDDDGCPDVDNDGDGFPDSLDRCPDSAGTDGGCPVYDTDNDGVPDSQDKCPAEAEDRDSFEDEDGCPDPDNDDDGVIDEKDNCPTKKEDTDGFEDGDGCPDLDNDGDGVPDAIDKCPGVRGLPDNDGCPKTKEIQRGKLVLSGVTFQPGKAVLSVNSYTILDNVYESLVEWPEVKLEIQGHTDNLGRSMANLKLSQKRADAVRLYLIEKGIVAERLRSVGYGEEFPIADNHTSDGREKNRRVELRRID